MIISNFLVVVIIIIIIIIIIVVVVVVVVVVFVEAVRPGVKSAYSDGKDGGVGGSE